MPWGKVGSLGRDWLTAYAIVNWLESAQGKRWSGFMYELIGEAGTNQREGAHLSLGLTQEPSILRAPSNAIRALLVFIMSLYYRHPSSSLL
jgi:hypothetical protein